MNDKLSREGVIEANRYVHSSIVEEYNNSPHFNPENKARVSSILDDLVDEMALNGREPNQIIDFCCGTGFIVDLVKNSFARVVGVDVTQEMLDKVDISSGNIELFNCAAENTPFDDNSFDMATAYSCLDHLLNYEEFFAEAYRVLKPGGILYIDLNPNRAFWHMLKTVQHMPELHENLSREIYNTLNNDERNSKKYNIDIDRLVMAEPIKNHQFGFDDDEVRAVAKKIGFSKFKASYHWFLNEGIVLHEQSEDHASTINSYFQSILPASKSLFKYLGFVLTK